MDEDQVLEGQAAPESLEQVDPEQSTDATKTEQAAEPTAEEQAAAEEQGFRIEADEKGRQYIIDDDGNRIPPERFKKIYHEAKEGERTREKFDLFKRLGPEAYYKAFPDEKPEGWGEQPQKAPAPQQVDIGSLLVNHPGSEYHGMALRDVYAIDPVYATNLQTNYLLEQSRESERQRSAEAQRTESAQNEILTFGRSIAKEMFGKDANDLTPEEIKAIDKTINEDIEWGKKTGRGGGNLHDIHILRTMEAKLSDAKNKAAKTVVDSLRKAPVGHIGGGPSAHASDNYEAMTEGQLAETVDNMSDAKKAEFYAKASPALRKKYPSWPWD